MSSTPSKIAAALTMVAVLGLGAATGSAPVKAGGPESPILLAQDPEAGATFAKAPDSVSLTFSQPLDPAYSKLEVYDQCGNRVDPGEKSVFGFQMSSEIVKRPAGKYKVFYAAGAEPKAATGETFGKFFFTVKKGPACH